MKEDDCAEKYGYRLPFTWELEEWKEIEQNYVLSKAPEEKYVHILDEEKKKKLANDILKKINGEDLVRKKDIEELHGEIKNLQIYREKEDKSTRQFLFNLDHLPQFFVERENMLKMLNEKLDIKRQEEMSQMILIHGGYGAGKSELAKSYAHSIKSSGNVVWINAKSCSTLSNSFYSLAKELGIPTEGYKGIQKINTDMEGKEQNDVQKKKIESIINNVYEKLQDVESHFIFDNTSEYEEIKKFLPPTGFVFGGKEPYVLITSRNKDWKEEIEKINLDKGFSSAEALMFIEKALEIKDNSQTRKMAKLAEVLSYFPLALKGATKCIKEEGISISEYLERFDKAIQQSNPDLLVAQGISKELFTALKVNFDKIRGEKNIGQPACNISYCMAYLDPNQIDTEEIFLQKKSEKDKQLIWSAVNLLHKFSVVELKESIAKIHEGTQKIIRLEQREKGTEEETLRGIMASLMNDSFINANHIISVWSHASKYKKLVNEFIDSVYDGSTILHLLAKDGNEEIIKLILEKVDLNKLSKVINAFNEEGYTPLSYAVIHGHLGIVKYFIEKGVSLEKDDNSFTPLHWATVCNQLEIVTYFIDNEYFEFNWINETNYSILYHAIECGHLNVVKYFVEYIARKGGDVNLWDRDGGSFLHYATICGRLGIVEYLVGQGADVNRQDEDGMSSLHHAVMHGYLDIVEHLIGQGADVNLQNKKGMSPLHHAAIYGYLGIVEYLVGKGASVNLQDEDGMSPLHFAVIYGHLGSIEYLVGAGTDLDLQDNYYMSPLHYAAIYGHLDIVDYLVEKGADVNPQNKEGESPLYFAVMHDHLGVIEYLVGKGNLQNKKGESPLHYAVIHGYLDIVKHLVGKGADVNLQNKKNISLLHFATKHGHLNVVKYLITQGAIVELRNKDGMSPLHHAATYGHLDIVDHLVEQGATVDLQDENDMSPLHHAAIHGHLDIINYLVGQGADVNLQNKEGEKPLHFAIVYGHINIVKCLIKGSTDVNLQDKRGQSFLDYAVENGYSDIADYLKEVYSASDLKVQLHKRKQETSVHLSEPKKKRLKSMSATSEENVSNIQLLQIENLADRMQGGICIERKTNSRLEDINLQPLVNNSIISNNRM